MWKVIRCFYDYEGVWKRTDSVHATEQGAEDEADRLGKNIAPGSDYFEVEEEDACDEADRLYNESRRND
jgi:hypothetical protein